MTVAEMKKNKAELIDEARSLMDAAEADGRTLNENEQERFDALMQEAETLTADIERRETLADAERSLNQRTGRITTPNVVTRENEGDDHLRSFLAGDTGKDFSFELRDKPFTGGSVEKWEQRALSFQATQGAELVPESFVRDVEVALEQFGGIRNVAQVLRTADGQDLPFPTSDDTANKATIVDPNAQRGEQDIDFGAKTLGAYTLSSGIVRIPFELIEDSAVDLGGFVSGRLGERLGRGLAGYLATGTGTDEPEGVVTGAAAGPTQATLGAITFDELLDIEHSVDPAYRENARWLFNDQTLRALKGLKNNDGDPIFVPANVSQGAPATVLGYPYDIVQELPDLDQVGARSIIFGDMRKLLVRVVRTIRLQRLTERYAEFGQVAILAHMRADSAVLDAGTGPIKAMENAAS